MSGLPATYLKLNRINLPTERLAQALLQVGCMTKVTSVLDLKISLPLFSSKDFNLIHLKIWLFENKCRESRFKI
ncbi:hypothetical protein AYI69_g9988 [Smittium culicis]|uniref:Uncharacterized protein n=1 Tax=Smittium culicis TaxID=133412 RepID=A0A1R1X8Y6_9FUNG|nr:hypothetical protein AYI69_g9988 [Smittium culicis]